MELFVKILKDMNDMNQFRLTPSQITIKDDETCFIPSGMIDGQNLEQLIIRHFTVAQLLHV
jgi:hypothetical protein